MKEIQHKDDITNDNTNSKHSDGVNTQQSVENMENNTNNKEAAAPRTHGKNRRKRRMAGMSAAMTALFLVLVVLFNIMVNVLTERYPSLNLDLTEQHANTLSEQAAKAVDAVKEPTTISIMVSEDLAKTDTLLAEYGIRYSQVSALAEKAAERNRNIQVEYIDLDKNPAFAAEYKNDGLMTADVLVKTEKRYRVLAYTDLFGVNQQETGETAAYSMVDSVLASALLSVTAEDLPLVVFDTGHAEMLDTTLYRSLLESSQFTTAECNLLTDPIPEDTGILVLAAPYTDFTPEEIEKIDAFLNDPEKEGDRSLLMSFDPGQTGLAGLSSYLAEWGLQVENTQVLEGSSGSYYTDPSEIFASVNQNGILSGTQYDYLLMPQSRAITRLFETRGDITTYELASASDKSYGYRLTADGQEIKTPEGKNTLAAVSRKSGTGKNGEYHANIVALGSSYLFVDGILNTTAFSDRSFVLDISRMAAGVENGESSIEIAPVQTTVFDIAMTAATADFLGIGVFMLIIPITICIIGIIIYQKRRKS